jgi:hypothetical protein
MVTAIVSTSDLHYKTRKIEEPLRVKIGSKKNVDKNSKSEYTITMPVGREKKIQSRRGWQGLEHNYVWPVLHVLWVNNSRYL